MQLKHKEYFSHMNNVWKSFRKTQKIRQIEGTSALFIYDVNTLSFHEFFVKIFFQMIFKHCASKTKMKRKLKLCLRLLLVFQDVNKSNAVSSPATAALARPLMSKSPFSCCSAPSPLGLGSSGLEQNTRPLNSSFNSWWKMTASCFWGSILHPMTEPVRSAVINLLP